MEKKKTKLSLRLIVSIVSALLFLTLISAYLTDHLGVNPIQKIQHLSGDSAITFLLLSLSITPLRTLTGWSFLGPLRRTFGLNAFYFAALHVLIFFGLDYQFNLANIIEAYGFRKYIWVGSAAFLILLVMAATSLRKMKKLVKKAWKKIHSFVYLAGILVVMHYAWSLKGITGKPLIAAVVLTLLLLMRLKPVKELVFRLRGKGRPTPVQSTQP